MTHDLEDAEIVKALQLSMEIEAKIKEDTKLVNKLQDEKVRKKRKEKKRKED